MGPSSAPASADVRGDQAPGVTAPLDEVATIATVATMSMSSSLEALVRAALATWMPRAAVSAMVRAEVVVRDDVGCVIVGPATDGVMALPELRRLRTQGYDGPVLLLVDAAADDGPGSDEAVELTRLGGRRCALGDGFGERLATMTNLQASLDADDHLFGGRRSGRSADLADSAVVDADADTDADAGMAHAEPKATGGSGARTIALHQELIETRRLLALAEVARRLPHALNNPLAALLAEAQLLELEELGPEQREAAERIVGLARRVIGLVRELQLALPRK